MGQVRPLLALMTSATWPIACVLAGCFSPRPPDNLYACVEDSACPYDTRCSNGTCVAGADLRAGSEHVCARKADGTLWCWGRSTDGDLGDGKIETGVEATQVKLLPGSRVIHHGAGSGFGCAVIEGAMGQQIYCWGNNGFHQVNDDGAPAVLPLLIRDQVSRPISALVLSPLAAIACVIADGNVWCWGQGEYGMLGPAATVSTAVPVPINGIHGVTAISIGATHACALTDGDNNVSCWGANDEGQLGQPASSSINPQPQPVPGLHAIALASGAKHTCAIDDQHVVKCWGKPVETGLAMSTHIPTPIPLPNDVRAEQIAAGNYSSCLVAADGAVWCWGDNTWGALGKAAAARFELVQIELPGPASAITLGVEFACTHVAGESYCWGGAAAGQLGDRRSDIAFSPGVVKLGDAPLDKVESILLGSKQSCARQADGTTYCWGWNQAGQLGDGSTHDSSQPVHAREYDHRKLSSGGGVVCWIDDGDVVRCRGDNSYAQLGFKGPVDSLAAAQTITIDGVPLVATKIAVGATFACAITGADAHVVCWGQLAEFGDAFSPTVIGTIMGGNLTNASDLAVGWQHACVSLTTKEVWCWGASNVALGLSMGPPASEHLLARRIGIDTADGVVAGGDFTCELDQTIPKLACLGINNEGQLGDDTTQNQFPATIPVALSGGAPIAVAAGHYHACVIDTTGSVRCWGDNEWGEIALDLTHGRALAPGAQILTSANQIAAEKSHTCATRTAAGEDRVVYCWGSDTFGGLGRGSILGVTPRRVTVLDAP